MKKLWKIGRNVFTVIISLLVIMLSLPMVSAEESVIPNDDSGIPDKTMYKYLISEFDENKDGKLQKSEADKIDTIYYNSYGMDQIESLKGVNKLINLRQLDVRHNSLKNLEGIEGLKLSYLNACYNQLIDITSISAMKDSLSVINVSYNCLSDIPNLTDFLKLKYDPYSPAYYATDFENNKLTYSKLKNNLPNQLINYKDGEMLKYWSKFQKPEPVQMSLQDEKTGLSVEGMIKPDSKMEIEKNVQDTHDNYIESYNISIMRWFSEGISSETPVKVSIPSKYNNCLLYLVNEEDDTKTLLETKYENGCYIFETSTLGKFILEKKYDSVEVGDVLVKGFFDTSKIHINKIEDFSSFDIANAKLAFDITLDNYDESNNIKISINSNERLYVCRITEDGNINLVDVIDSRYVDGKIEFSPKHLGKFVLYSDLTGDVNDNGVVNIVDATLIQKYTTKVMTFNQIELQVADYNNDGKVNVKDCTAIQKSLVVK